MLTEKPRKQTERQRRRVIESVMDGETEQETNDTVWNRDCSLGMTLLGVNRSIHELQTKLEAVKLIYNTFRLMCGALPVFARGVCVCVSMQTNSYKRRSRVAWRLWPLSSPLLTRENKYGNDVRDKSSDRGLKVSFYFYSSKESRYFRHLCRCRGFVSSTEFWPVVQLWSFLCSLHFDFVSAGLNRSDSIFLAVISDSVTRLFRVAGHVHQHRGYITLSPSKQFNLSGENHL